MTQRLRDYLCPKYVCIIPGLLLFFMEVMYNQIMNRVITIPRKFASADDLVVLPRKEYETLVRGQVDKVPLAELTEKQRKAIAKSEKELAQGQYVTLEQLEHARCY